MTKKHSKWPKEPKTKIRVGNLRVRLPVERSIAEEIAAWLKIHGHDAEVVDNNNSDNG